MQSARPSIQNHFSLYSFLNRIADHPHRPKCWSLIQLVAGTRPRCHCFAWPQMLTSKKVTRKAKFRCDELPSTYDGPGLVMKHNSDQIFSLLCRKAD